MPSVWSGPGPVQCTLRMRATPEAIFAILADPRRHPEIDGSGTLRGHLHGPETLTSGSRFGMSMRYWGIPYRITNTVTEFEPGRRIAWAHLSRVVWRYDLTPVASGAAGSAGADGPLTDVTETWDPAGSPIRLVYGVLGFPRRTVTAIMETLHRLDAAAREPVVS